jgi:hypothetical protein
MKVILLDFYGKVGVIKEVMIMTSILLQTLNILKRPVTINVSKKVAVKLLH